MSHTDIFCCFLAVYHHYKPNFSLIILAYVQKTKKNTKKNNKIMSPSKASVCDIFDNINMAFFDKLELVHSLSQIYHVGMFLST